MTNKRILILGAGLAGLSAAWHLKQKGLESIVFEQESDVGGLCRSRQINGFGFDYDGHLLHFKHQYIRRLVFSLLKGNLVRHRRNAWVYTHKKFIPYPFQANLYGLPAKVAQECLLGFIENHQNGSFQAQRNGHDFLIWVKTTFGRGIAKHFLFPYNRKFWQVPLRSLTCEWLDGFIPVPSLSQVIEAAIEENRRQFGYNAWFWYPKKGGISQLALSLAAGLRNIHTKSRVAEIDPLKKKIKLACGLQERYDYLISTLPLPDMPQIVKGMPPKLLSSFKRLRWNSILNLNLGLNNAPLDKRHWIYLPQKEIRCFRVGFYHNFSLTNTPAAKSSLYAELAFAQDRRIEISNAVRDIKTDLQKLGLLTGKEVICAEEANYIKYGYPIYDKNYRSSRDKIRDYLVLNDILPCGRYGSWRYFSMEDAILDGKRAADSLSNV
jgi:protoporphyrinogen oxidase